MKLNSFGQGEINMSKATFERGVRACLALRSPTRATVAEAAGISPAYSGKILSALTECGFLCEDRSASPSAYQVNPALSVLVLDISNTAFSASVICGDGTCVMHKKAEMISELSFSEYLYSSLSCLTAYIEELSCFVSAICVLHDGKRLAKRGQRELIDGVFASLYGTLPLLYVSIDDAVSAILDYGLCPIPKNKRLGYVRLTDVITSLFVTEDKSVFRCDPSRLIFQGDATVNEVYFSAYSSIETGAVISRIMTAIDFTLEMGAFIIESDSFKIDAVALEMIRQTYTATGSRLPENTRLLFLHLTRQRRRQS